MQAKQLNKIVRRIEIAYRKKQKNFGIRLTLIHPDKIRKVMRESRIGLQCKKCLNKGYGRYCSPKHGSYYRNITDQFYGNNMPFAFEGINKDKYGFRKDKKINCPNCNIELDWKQMSIDHIIPITRGGLEFDRNNLQWMCLTCNIKKNNHTKEELESKAQIKKELIKAILPALAIQKIVEEREEQRQLRLSFPPCAKAQGFREAF